MTIKLCPICGTEYNNFDPTILKVDECDALGEFFGPVSFYQCDVCDANFGIFDDHSDEYNQDLELLDLEQEIEEVKRDRPITTIEELKQEFTNITTSWKIKPVYQGLDNYESD